MIAIGTESLGRQGAKVLVLVKGQERYVFLYDDASRAEVLRVFGRFASDLEFSFTWYDAAVLAKKVRQETHADPASFGPPTDH
jgi:hypothetical protein